MNWISIAIIAYFILSLSQVIDKFLLSDRVPKPHVYAFYVGLLSLTTFFWAPFGFKFESPGFVLFSIFVGSFFIYAIYFLYKATRENEISRVSPLTGAFVAIFTLLLSRIFFDEKISPLDTVGFFLLVFGGLLISFDLPIRSKKIFRGFKNCLISGFLFAIYYVLLSKIYKNEAGFINDFIWTRLGLFFGSVSFLLIPAFKKDIVDSFKNYKKDEKRNFVSGIIFVFNKALGGGYSILHSYAIKLGSVSIVNAMNSLQFVFVLILSYFAFLKYPKLFQENISITSWSQKIISILFIGGGIALVLI